MHWKVSKAYFLISNRVRKSIIFCQSFLAQIQGKMTLSLNKTTGYCIFSGLSAKLALWKPPQEISLFHLRKYICHYKQNKDQIKKGKALSKKRNNLTCIINLRAIFYIAKENESIKLY